MNQFVLVQAEAPERAEELLLTAVSLFRRILHADPADSLAAGRTRAAVFPLLARPGAGISRCPVSGRWALGAGTPFYDGRTGRDALDSILRDGTAAPDYGMLSAERTEGLFAIVLGQPDGAFQLLTDRLGNLHVYERRVRGGTVISTSSLILASLESWSPDWHGCRQFLSTGTVFGRRSPFAGVEKLGPARVFSYGPGAARTERIHWDLRDRLYGRTQERGDLASTAGALVAAMDTILAAYPNALLDLTGGYDSRCVLAAALETGRPFTTIVNGPDNAPDVETARRIAREFGLKLLHTPPPAAGPLECWSTARECLPLTDGEYDVTLYQSAFRAHSGRAREFDVTVNGSNGEITKGYWYELLMPHTGKRGHFDSRRIAAARFTFEGEPAGLLAHDFPTSVTDDLAAEIDAANAGLEDCPNTSLLDSVYLTLRMHRWQGRISSSTQRIWPGASPFMFRRPMELSLAVPGVKRARLAFTTRLIERLNPRLAALPLEYGYPALPVRAGNLHRFLVPGWKEYWPKLLQKAGLRKSRGTPGGAAPDFTLSLLGLDEVREMLRPRRMASAYLYRPDALAAWLGRIEQADSRERNRLGRVLTLELLARALPGQGGRSTLCAG